MRFFLRYQAIFQQLPNHLAEPFSVWLQWYSHIMVTPPQTVLPTFSLSSFFSFWTFPDLVFIGEGPRLPMSKFIKSLIYNMKKTFYLQHEKKNQRLTKTSVKKKKKMCLWNTNAPYNGQCQRWPMTQGKISYR